jgi:hypothetical protein
MMVTLDPTTDTETARELLRELAHTTRSMTGPAETAAMIGSLASGLDALRQVLDQLSGWHERAADGAVDPAGDGDVGYRSAFDVAIHLSQAAMEIERAATAVDAAHQTASHISWPAAQQESSRVPAVRSERRLAPPSLFGIDDTRRQEPAGISR